jgi:hypothetical protein
MSHIPTIRVKPWSKDQGPFVILNEEDFDPERHELYVDAEEAARLEREAEEKARAEAERIAAARQAQSEVAPAPQEGQGGPAPEQSEGEDSAAAQPAAGEHETPPWDEDGAAGAQQGTGQAESAAGAPVSAESGNGAATTEAPSLTVGKGPKGLWFVKAGGVIASPGFPTEEAANAALAEIAAGDQK